MTNHSKYKDAVSKILAIRKVEPEMIGELFRGFVPEIVEMTLELSPKCKCCKLLSSSQSQSLELKFLDKISTPVFTGQKIKAERCASIRVALYDCATGAVVKSGPEANANIELVVLQGDSDRHGGDSLTVEDFERKIVKTIKGKKSLLKGNTMLKLKEGCCDVGELSFIHNSGWVKTCQLSLAARVVDNFPGTMIQPATTEYFTLKDCRTKLYLKKYPPALSDEIWRLNKIGKKGAIRELLKGENVESVEDFLRFLVMEPERLENIRLSAGPKTWEAITEHARTCIIDETVRYCYHTNPEHTHGVVFNVVGELKGLLRESLYVPVDGLSDLEKMNARESVMCAFQQGELTPYNDDNSFIRTGPPFSAGSPGLKNPNESADDYAQPAGTLPHANIPFISCVGESSRPDHGLIQSDASMDFLQVLLDCPMYSPESAHHHCDGAMLQCKTPSMLQGDQSTPEIVLLDPQVVSTFDVWQRWRRVLTILNAIVTVKSIAARGKFGAQKKRKFSSLVHI